MSTSTGRSGTPLTDEATGLLMGGPLNRFTSERREGWDRIKAVAEANNCVPNMLEVLSAARASNVRVFYALHRRYRPGDYESWEHMAPVQRAAWRGRVFEAGTWGGEVPEAFGPQPD